MATVGFKGLIRFSDYLNVVITIHQRYRRTDRRQHYRALRSTAR